MTHIPVCTMKVHTMSFLHPKNLDWGAKYNNVSVLPMEVYRILFSYLRIIKLREQNEIHTCMYTDMRSKSRDPP